MTQSSKTLWYFIAAVTALVVIQWLFTVYTNYLWFDSLGQAAVFGTMLKARIGLAVVFGGLFFAWLYGNVRLARRPLPQDVTLIGRRLLPEEEREQIEQYADRAILIFCVVGAVMVAAVASGQWRDWLLFINAIPFSEVGEHADPIFGKDAGFYVFRLSFILYAWRSVFYAVVIALAASVLVHLYQEAIRVVGSVVQAIPRARKHVLGLVSLALLAKIYSYRLMQYSLLYSTHGKDFFGASYADIHARMPLMTVLMVMCALAAIACLVSIRGRSLTLPGGAVAAVIIVAVLGGWAYPAAIEKLVVAPNELQREAPFIAHNIKATNVAYGTGQINDRVHPVDTKLTWADVRANIGTISNIRLWDHRPLETVYQQTQALRRYYEFADVDVDRYEMDGQLRQVMLSARQLAYDRISDSWVNRHLLYTHGYGVAMSPVAEITDRGQPIYWIKNLPPSSAVDFEIKRPAIYYTASWHPRLIERITPPQFVRDEVQARRQPVAPIDDSGQGASPAPNQPLAPATAPHAGGQGEPGRPRREPLFVLANTHAKELHYPRETGRETGDADDDGNVYHHYEGTGGVQMNSWWRKLAFAIRFRDVGLLLTKYSKPDSRLMMYREMPERLTALAPFLGYDPDPYIVIDDDGHLKWMCDAYTVSNMYPYSIRTSWYGNYVRNSVKVVVDAYEGRPEFYVVDPNEPLVQVYQRIFPTLFTAYEQMDPALKRHVRYPALLYRIQAGIYAKYHMKDPQTFYQAEDEWAIPPEVYSDTYREVEAYYQVMRLPYADQEEFVLMLPFTLAKFERRNMVAWMAARCDPEHYGQLICYRFPKERLVYGPMQFEAKIDADPGLSEQFTLWSQTGSRIIRGNALAIPVADTLLYVEPVYLESTDSPIPEMKLIILMHGDRLAYATNLERALEQLLGHHGQHAPMLPVTDDEEAILELPTPDTPSVVAPPVTPAKPTAPPTGVAEDRIAQASRLLEQALALEQEAEGFLKQGDLGGYRAKQQEQQKLLLQASELLSQ